jgi:hypothetical protein
VRLAPPADPSRGARPGAGPGALKNLIQEADRQLGDRGAGPHQARTLLEPAHVLLQDPAFWEHQAGGLAVFAAPGFARWFRLPIELPELAVVTRRFHLKPLLPYFQGDGRLFVLALSQHAVRLLAGSRNTVHEVDVGHMIRNARGALNRMPSRPSRTRQASALTT